MNDLTLFNEKIFTKYKSLSFDLKREISLPLLTSSSENYIQNLDRKIMYVGREENGWMSNSLSFDMATRENLESKYYDFLKNDTYKTQYWKFIRQLLQTDNIVNSVIWTNMFICGQRIGYRKPGRFDKLLQMSEDNINFLRDFFKPQYTIFVCGPFQPYNSMLQHFLQDKQSSLITQKPTKNKPVVYDDINKIIWTYHPEYLEKKQMKEKVLKEIQGKINR